MYYDVNWRRDFVPVCVFCLSLPEAAEHTEPVSAPRGVVKITLLVRRSSDRDTNPCQIDAAGGAELKLRRRSRLLMFFCPALVVGMRERAF